MASAIKKAYNVVSLALWDISLVIINAVTPNRPVGAVVPKDKVGANGLWPEYIPPGPNDSRSPCPALNALANAGVLPHDGKNIRFTTLAQVCQDQYNFAPTFCWFTADYAARMFGKDYHKDTMDLSDLSAHNGIEHDASLTRYDIAVSPDQSKPALDLVNEFLDSATGTAKPEEGGGKLITITDLAKFSAKRRAHSRQTNGQYMMANIHKTFSSSNNATMLTIFGGRVDDLRIVLTEERLPEGWEPRIRASRGLTMLRFNLIVFPLEKKTKAIEAAAKKQT